MVDDDFRITSADDDWQDLRVGETALVFGRISVTAFNDEQITVSFADWTDLIIDTPGGGAGALGERYRCMADGGAVLFRPDGDGWSPDPDTLRPYRFVEADRRFTRALSKAHHLADFGLWLSMAPRHKRIEHREVDLYMVSDMLKERDFESAAMHLPLIEDTGAFGTELKPVPIITTERNRFVTMSSIERFRIWLYDQEGAYSPIDELVVSAKAYWHRKTFINQLAKAGGSNLGWTGW